MSILEVTRTTRATDAVLALVKVGATAFPPPLWGREQTEFAALAVPFNTQA